MADVVTVAIPVLDGAEYLDEVLTAVRAQEVDREVEILIVDSGSTDGSVEIARAHGAVVHEIPRAEFSHGGTRNRMMELARGGHVAFLTQDATPAHTRWLAALLEGFEQVDRVAAVFGPHVARPEASHVIKAEMERHFANWGDGREIAVQRLDSTPKGFADYRARAGWFTFLSSVNCCIARSAWKRVPFRPVRYAEDNLLGRELIEAGYAKVFHPEAAVLHSHHYPPVAFLRRYFDEYRGLREVLDHREPAGLRHTLRSVRSLTRADRSWLREHGVGGARLRLASAASVRHHTLRIVGASLGSRADRLPAPARRRLSLEGRDSFTRADVPRSKLLLDREGVQVRANWGWEFVREAYPAQRVALEQHAGRDTGPLSIAWIVPPWGIGSGGHAVIFRLIRELEQRGHTCTIFVFDPFGMNAMRGRQLRAQIREHFTSLQAEVLIGLDRFDSADVAVATNWWTAYPLRDLPHVREKVYFVQDHEPRFAAASAEGIWAEETYRMGLRCVAYTPWLAHVLENRYGAEVALIDCGTDTDTYTFAAPEGREPGLIVVYARVETSRRAVELAFAGLASLYERRVDHRVVVFGSSLGVTVPFPCENLGVVSPEALAKLYRRASVGVVFSLTNLSLVTQEMMAAGLPVVELDGENVRSVLGAPGRLARLAEPRPDAVADEIGTLLDDPAEAAAMAERARAFVDERTWTRAGDQLEAALRGWIDRPREAPAPLPPPPFAASGWNPARQAPPGMLAREEGRATKALYARLRESDVRAVEGRLNGDDERVLVPGLPGQPPRPVNLAGLWRERKPELEERRLTLTLAAHYDVEEALQRTGLRAASPPEDVHSMAHGPLAAGGSLYHADLVADALAGSGAELGDGMRVLDFGCSSGRVVRVLAAAFPEVKWHGCDPIEGAIDWAREHLPGIDFRVSPEQPPLPYEDESFDAVYAISIWSHFSEQAAIRWLEEMWRIVRPGGRLLLTTHGYQTVSHYFDNRRYPPEKLSAIRDELYSSGFWFEAVFGPDGDWGVGSQDWGMTFLTPEWLAKTACPPWSVVEFAPGRNEDDQDVFVLERRAATVEALAEFGSAPETS